MVKLTLKELLEVTQTGAFGRFLEIPKPVSVAWANRRAGKSSDAELKAYDERRGQLAKECGATVEDIALPDGKPAKEFRFPDGGAEKFAAGMDELVAQEVEIDAVPVKVTDLRGDLSEADMSRLEKFVTE